MSKRVLMLFPPVNAKCRYPEIGMPRLTAVQRQRGVETRQIDLSARLMHGVPSRRDSPSVLLDDEAAVRSVMRFLREAGGPGT